MEDRSQLTLASVLFLLGCGNCAQGLLLLVLHLGPIFPRHFITWGLFLFGLAGLCAGVRIHRTAKASRVAGAEIGGP
jgi:hypothetical protein